MKSSALWEPKCRHLYLESYPTPVILSISVYLLSTKLVCHSQKEIGLICRAEDLRLAELKGGIVFPKIQSYSLRMLGKLSRHWARKSTRPATETPRADVFLFIHLPPTFFSLKFVQIWSNLQRSCKGMQCEGGEKVEKCKSPVKPLHWSVLLERGRRGRRGREKAL